MALPFEATTSVVRQGFIDRHADVAIVGFSIALRQSSPRDAQGEASLETAVFENYPIKNRIILEYVMLSNFEPLLKFRWQFEEDPGETVSSG